MNFSVRTIFCALIASMTIANCFGMSQQAPREELTPKVVCTVLTCLEFTKGCLQHWRSLSIGALWGSHIFSRIKAYISGDCLEHYSQARCSIGSIGFASACFTGALIGIPYCVKKCNNFLDAHPDLKARFNALKEFFCGEGKGWITNGFYAFVLLWIYNQSGYHA